MTSLQRLPTRAWIAAGLAAAVALVGFAFGAASAQEEEVEIYKTAAGEHWGYEDPVFVVVAGTDDRPGVSGARADALHVVGINYAERRGTIINIPRDTYTNIPGRGTRKINEAHTAGGAELLGQTVAALTGANVQFVVTSNFEGFTNIVNEAGGVDIDIPIPINDSASGAAFGAGPHHLSGEAALALARARKGVPRGDFTRSHHQGLLLLAALKQTQGRAPSAADMVRNVAGLLRHLKTTSGVTPADLYQLSRMAVTIPTDAIPNITMPGSTGSAGGASVVFPGPAAAPLFADFADDGIVQSPPTEDGAGNTFG